MHDPEVVVVRLAAHEQAWLVNLLTARSDEMRGLIDHRSAITQERVREASRVAATLDQLRFKVLLATSESDKEGQPVGPDTAPALTLQDVSEQLGRSIRTVKRYVTSGLLPATKVGGRRLVSRADLDAFQAGDR